jgi:hypothetical protein
VPRDASPTVIRPLLSDSGTVAFPAIAVNRRSVIAVFAYSATKGTPARSVAMTLPVCSPVSAD